MQTLDQHLLSLVERGLVTPQEALAKAMNIDYLRARISELPAPRKPRRGG